jgi:hypothetical protein
MTARLEPPLTFELLVETIVWPDDADKCHSLIEDGLFDKDFIDPHHGSLLCSAASYYSTDTALVLLTAGVDVNAVDAHGMTPLHLAIWHMRHSRYASEFVYINVAHMASRAMVDLLIYHGADLSVQDAEGNTPLHVAARVNEPFIMQTLIREGAWRYLSTKNGAGDTAQDIAVNRQLEYPLVDGIDKYLNEKKDWDHYAKMRKLDVKGYDEPDYNVPVGFLNCMTYKRINQTADILKRAREQYDVYFTSIAVLSSRGIPADLIPNLVQLPTIFDPYYRYGPQGELRARACQAPQEIYKELFDRGWIRSIEGIVRRILYPDKMTYDSDIGRMEPPRSPQPPSNW